MAKPAAAGFRPVMVDLPVLNSGPTPEPANRLAMGGLAVPTQFRRVILAMALFALPSILNEASAAEMVGASGCQTQLEELNSYLQGESLGDMSRLGQGPIRLRNGEWYPASEIDSIRQELHRAERFCREGRAHEAANEMVYVRRHLHLATAPPSESFRSP